MSRNKILVYGYGNPGRQDDGLGAALVEKLNRDNMTGVVTDVNYQLNLEDALSLTGKSHVIFVDAAIELDEPFTFSEIEPAREVCFTTHAMTPQSLLAVHKELYNNNIKAYILAIRGYNWDLKEELTREAGKNLEKAYAYIKNFIKTVENKKNAKL